jgi:hypothetical protein
MRAASIFYLTGTAYRRIREKEFIGRYEASKWKGSERKNAFPSILLANASTTQPSVLYRAAVTWIDCRSSSPRLARTSPRTAMFHPKASAIPHCSSKTAESALNRTSGPSALDCSCLRRPAQPCYWQSRPNEGECSAVGRRRNRSGQGRYPILDPRSLRRRLRFMPVRTSEEADRLRPFNEARRAAGFRRAHVIADKRVY